jgi:hypothetical protein
MTRVRVPIYSYPSHVSPQMSVVTHRLICTLQHSSLMRILWAYLSRDLSYGVICDIGMLWMSRNQLNGVYAMSG